MQALGAETILPDGATDERTRAESIPSPARHGGASPPAALGPGDGGRDSGARGRGGRPRAPPLAPQPGAAGRNARRGRPARRRAYRTRRVRRADDPRRRSDRRRLRLRLRARAGPLLPDGSAPQERRRGAGGAHRPAARPRRPHDARAPLPRPGAADRARAARARRGRVVRPRRERRARGPRCAALRVPAAAGATRAVRSEEHTSELQSLRHLVCRLLLEKTNCHNYETIYTKHHKRIPQKYIVGSAAGSNMTYGHQLNRRKILYFGPKDTKDL